MWIPESDISKLFGYDIYFNMMMNVSLHVHSFRSPQLVSRHFCDTKYGFAREDMKKKSCVATVKPYKKHLVVCSGTSDWPSEIHKDNSDNAFNRVYKEITLRARDHPMKFDFKLNASDEQPTTKDASST
jgi:hypothetical protein